MITPISRVRNRLGDVHDLPAVQAEPAFQAQKRRAVIRAFTRNAGGEQIDAASEMDSWHYIVECRWRAELADIRELDGLAGQVARTGRQTMGLFPPING